MNSLADVSLKSNPPNLNHTWRFELGHLNADEPETYRTFSEAWPSLIELSKRGLSGLYLLDRFAGAGRPQLWGRGDLGIVCISRRVA